MQWIRQALPAGSTPTDLQLNNSLSQPANAYPLASHYEAFQDNSNLLLLLAQFHKLI